MSLDNVIPILLILLAAGTLVRVAYRSVRRFGPGPGTAWVGLWLLGASRLNPRNRRRLRRWLGLESFPPRRPRPRR